jgi:hypothetical protein
VWILGIALGLVFAIGAIALNLQKAVVIVATSLLGAWSVIGTFLFLFTSATPESIADDGVKMVLDDHPLWFLVFAVVAAFGMLFQFQVNRGYEIERYNRWAESTGAAPSASPPAM